MVEPAPVGKPTEPFDNPCCPSAPEPAMLRSRSSRLAAARKSCWSCAFCEVCQLMVRPMLYSFTAVPTRNTPTDAAIISSIRLKPRIAFDWRCMASFLVIFGNVFFKHIRSRLWSVVINRDGHLDQCRYGAAARDQGRDEDVRV